MTIKNYTSKNYQNGQLTLKLIARESSYYFDENRSIAEDIELHYYDKGKLAAVIKGDKAIINTTSRNIELIGNVDGISPSGNRLLTSRIIWNDQGRFLDTDEPVKIIKSNGDIIKGIGLRANYNLEDYEIKKNVRAITRDTDKIIKKKKDEK